VVVQHEDLQFRYKPAYLDIVFDGHQIELFGDFGSVTHVSSSGEVNFNAYKAVFKFPAEHTIDGEIHSAEL